MVFRERVVRLAPVEQNHQARLVAIFRGNVLRLVLRPGGLQTAIKPLLNALGVGVANVAPVTEVVVVENGL